MQFKVGDHVVHPVYGVGHIVRIEKKQLSEKETPLYYKLALPRRTIWVPTETQTKVGLRLVTAKTQLDRYRDLLKNHPVSLSDNHAQRHTELANSLKQGSFEGMCKVVRELTVSGWQKPLGRSDAAILQKTREKLIQEWSTSAGISVTEATEEIGALLLATREVENG